MKFTKYHGAGNDFVIIDAREHKPKLNKEKIATICHRRFGVGADGFMTLENDPAGSEFYMRYWNADGGESTMCGNGGRCIALFAHHLGIGGMTKHFNSSDGYHSVQIIEADGRKGKIRLGMIDINQVISYQDGAYFVFTGSPHYVEFVDDVMSVDVLKRGSAIRNSEKFAKAGGTNVNFVQIIDQSTIKVRTFERGVEDETLACGTGATAAAIITSHISQTDCKSFKVYVMGGELNVNFDKNENSYSNVTLSGEAEKVFEGIFL